MYAENICAFPFSMGCSNIIPILHKKHKEKLDSNASYMIEFTPFMIEYESNRENKDAIITKRTKGYWQKIYKLHKPFVLQKNIGRKLRNEKESIITSVGWRNAYCNTDRMRRF